MLAVDVTDDPATARAVWANLRRLADSGADPSWREMAREVVEGRLTTRQLMSYGAYQEAMVGRFEELAEKWRDMPDAERAELVAPDPDDEPDPVGPLVEAAEADVIQELARPGGMSVADATALMTEIRRDAR
ncbi:MAG: hypothetical protein GEV28_28700 [Actinophytocola sp.]|uniref:hypothetical protein n=1 Tax=Actinophytocola sp. TaxID=1872138 RepID=UPI00132715B6|nr:hypothetical protein [Actinophytocola sp.]MPZ84165.1 hypothetical protein [Actinophytocola sp.]